MTIKPIKTENDYNEALKRAEFLMGVNDLKSSEELEVIQQLIENWERRYHIIEDTSPAEAIRFRMDQTGLKPRDLVPYLGTKSRVSEILGGQRQLTVDQIRALHQHLSIPLNSLIGPVRYASATRPSSVSASAARKLRTLGIMKAKEELTAFLSRTATLGPSLAMLRKTRTERTNAKTDFGVLEAWCGAVLLKAETAKTKPYKSFDAVSEARKLAQLSLQPDWANRVKERLSDLGVIFIVLEHLPGTFLDGAAMRRRDGIPIIALTLRHDRIDNFWFTLLHEFAHVCCHLNDERSAILDDLDVSAEGEIEAQADAFAIEALIPKKHWEGYIFAGSSSDELKAAADRAGVHPAIAAGRWQYRHRDYRKFSKLLGRGEVREAFTNG
jgi:HTH-type transcriptional regulator / antitoxin HigA